MSINGIFGSALSGLTASQTALGTISNNIANMNTTGYAREVVNQQAQVSGSQLTGVSVSDIQRITDQFLNAEVLTAQGTASQYGAQNDTYTQLNGLLGSPGDGTALTTQLDNVFSALGSASLAPTSSTNQQTALTAFSNLASTISNLSSSLQGLRTSVDQQISATTGTVNALLKQIYSLNTQISSASSTSTPPNGLMDQRDNAVQQLAQYIGIKTQSGPNGQLVVSTQDGVTLVGDSYAQLSYTSSNGTGGYPPIEMSMIDPATGQSIGSTTALDPHLSSGKLKGYIDMRDGALAQLAQELGNFAQTTANAFNAQSNANTSYPAPSTLTGRDTGLMSSDAMNFTGKTTIAITDANGNLVHRIDVNFSTGQLSVDGGANMGFGSTIADFLSTLNGALGANGSASFANGALTLSASGGNGIVVQDDATTPSSRGGTSFSQFFGLNDIFRTSGQPISATGLSASDAGNFAAGGAISMSLKNASGQIVKTASVTLTGSETIGNIVSALNTAFGGAATFTLGANGALTQSLGSAYANDSLSVTQDTTNRGDTGMSFTQLFGVGPDQQANLAANFSVNPQIASTPQDLPFAQASLAGASVGASVITPGDARGLTALQNVATNQQSFSAAGALAAQTTTLGSYAASFYQDAATRSAAAQSANTEQSDRLSTAQTQQSSVSGVNLDQELSNMMSYQQAYSASARVLQAADSLYTTLLQIQ
ncbi:MAG: flagellar hook-associated protein FlgK [Alphaproteobacteria bacterium]|nr:flagellar hook-associated protein FlgK [Alphaproteobacteria bacterium]